MGSWRMSGLPSVKLVHNFAFMLRSLGIVLTVFVLLIGGCNYGVGIRFPDGKAEEITPILGCSQFDQDGLPICDDSLLPTYIHELCHSYSNKFVDRFVDQLRRAGERIYPSAAELLARAHALAGLTLGELATSLGRQQPGLPLHTKGWMGTLLEQALGADAGSRPLPDFTQLEIELKTIPVTAGGVPRESTFVCMAPAVVNPNERWENSLVYRKLRRVLWLPIETRPAQPLAERRIGWAVPWSPTIAQATTLRADWEELIELIATGQRAVITARLGEYLQIRPKAADHRATTRAADAGGNPDLTLPRGFYLRASFTREILITAFTHEMASQ